ncbi:hypothetical protein PHAVU_009G090600 [Phaseolus vulgaris]|uniref:Uncharacterized protein n=1 Tax=Phaseolus vulgaris TaxID=3885 RepID=V7AUI1_PHAVU|nr:hypothetical protein PHAVU_009G090600g [Phaseolus vulgaris]ESW08980.1 hypothetical protein PHAVU_009G090600g [Phaseolus vulgaris]
MVETSSSSRLHAINCVQDCDRECMFITSNGCFRELCAAHRFDELCREEQNTLKVHRKRLGKKLKKVVKAFPKRLKMCSGGAKEKEKSMRFQYDPKSYALNFDDGIQGCDGVFLDFSARYACPLGINKVYLGWDHTQT